MPRRACCYEPALAYHADTLVHCTARARDQSLQRIDGQREGQAGGDATARSDKKGRSGATTASGIRAMETAQEASACMRRTRQVDRWPRYRHKRQSRLFMLLRRNVSVCAPSLRGLYFYRVSSPPATSEGSMRPLAGDPGGARGVSGDATPDANGELRATGVGEMSGVADAGAVPPAGEIQDDTGATPVVVFGPAPAGDGGDGLNGHVSATGTDTGPETGPGDGAAPGLAEADTPSRPDGTDPAASTDPADGTDPAASTDPADGTDPAASTDPADGTDPADRAADTAEASPVPADTAPQ